MTSQTSFFSSCETLASCHAILVNSIPVWATSPPPRAKKKLAPKIPFPCSSFANVRAIVDFPVPAMPFSQKICCSCSLLAYTNTLISSSTAVRVCWRHSALSCWLDALKGACAATGNRDSSLSWSTSSESDIHEDSKWLLNEVISAHPMRQCSRHTQCFLDWFQQRSDHHELRTYRGFAENAIEAR